MRFITMASFLALTVVASFSAIAGNGLPASVNDAKAQNSASFAAAQSIAADLVTRDEERRAQIDLAVAPIRSAGTLKVYTSGQLGKTPLDSIPGPDRTAFIKSLKFNDRGITEFNYEALSSLTSTQAYQVLALFGQQRFTSALPNVHAITPEDSLIMVHPMLLPLLDYRCEDRGTCSKWPGKACTDNC